MTLPALVPMWALAIRHICPAKRSGLSRTAWAVEPTFSFVRFIERQIGLASGGFKADSVTAKVAKSGEFIWGDWHGGSIRQVGEEVGLTGAALTE